MSQERCRTCRWQGEDPGEEGRKACFVNPPVPIPWGRSITWHLPPAPDEHRCSLHEPRPAMAAGPRPVPAAASPLPLARCPPQPDVGAMPTLEPRREDPRPLRRADSLRRYEELRRR